ncbi:cytochrome c oxidase assembly protein [Spirillospora sp. CA-255316]
MTTTDGRPLFQAPASGGEQAAGAESGSAAPAGAGPTRTGSAVSGSAPPGAGAAARTAGSRPAAPWLPAAAAALLVLALVVRFGGAFSAEVVPGLTRTGALTKGGLAVAELAAHACGAVTVGWLLLVAVFLPAGAPAAVVRRFLRAASLWASAWALCVLAVVMFSVSDLFGVPVTTGVSGNMLRTFLLELSQGRALLVVAVAAVAAAVIAQVATRPGGAGYALLVALGGLVPPVFTGHAAGAAYHAAAVYSLVAHVLAAALWVGGLVVLVAVARDPLRAAGWELGAVVARYSRLAAVCFAVVALSGLVNAWIRLGGWDVGSRYGTLVVAKTAALAGLGAFGWWHRRVSVPALRAGREQAVASGTDQTSAPRGDQASARGGSGGGGRGTFVRIAAVEIVVMAATMALATGLSRTPPPEVPQGTLDPVALRLGFPLPGPASWGAYLLEWRIDPLLSVVVLVAAVLYAAGVVRSRRAGRPWPLTRVLAWYAGLGVMLLVTCGGLARYSMVLFSAHVVQHMVLSVVVPVLLLAGAPVSLALRSLPRSAEGGGRSARELLVAVLRSRAVALACHPLVAPVVFVAGLYGFYLSPVFEASLRNHALHTLVMLVWVVSAVAYLWPVMGADPLPRRPSPRVRFALAAVVVPFPAVFGAAVAGRSGVLAADWYGGLGRAWGDGLLQDQRVGGGLAWALGEIAALAVIAALARHWILATPATQPAPAPAAAQAPSATRASGSPAADGRSADGRVAGQATEE